MGITRSDVLEIRTLHVTEWPVANDFPVFEVDRAAAHLLEQRVIVSGRDDDAPGFDEGSRPFLDDCSKFVVQRLVDLIEEQDSRFKLLCDREAESRTHALRVRQDGILEGVT